MAAKCGSAKRPGCGAPIDYVETEAGKLMPINPQPAPNGNLIKTGTTQRMVSNELHTIATVMVVKADDPTPLDRYLSHFATCPFAGQNRRKPKRRV